MASIPVLGYHRIGSPDPENLSLSVADFARHCEYLTGAGYRTLTMGELYRHVTGERRCRGRCVALTFDDGFRDILLDALPVLQQYNVKATVFAIADRSSDAARATFDRSLDFNQSHALAWEGDHRQFLARREIDTLKQSGLIEIHAHSTRHNQVFTDAAVTGIYPDTDRHWGIVAAYDRGRLDGRWPVFRRGAGLTHRRWKANTAAIAAAMTEARELTTANLLKTWTASGVPADWLVAETLEAQRERVRDDLAHAHAAFANDHEAGLDAMCWPWGAHAPELDAIAGNVGFRLALRTSAGSNAPGDDPMAIHRLPVRRASIVRLAVGLWLRRVPWLARVYGLIHRRV